MMMKEKEKMLFDPDDKTRVKSYEFGVWSVWQDISGSSRVFSLPFLSKAKVLMKAYEGRPYLEKMMADVSAIEGCWHDLVLWLLLSFVHAFIPAASLWYTSQLLKVVETAVETRTVDTQVLMRTAGGRIFVPLFAKLLLEFSGHAQSRMRRKIERFYSLKAFQASARLDVPTYNDPRIKRAYTKMQYRRYTDFTWDIFAQLIYTFSSIINLFSTFLVLVSVFKGHSEAVFFLVSNLARLAIESFGYIDYWSPEGVFAYKATNEDYVYEQGLKRVAQQDEYRKDLVAGGLGDAITQQYERCVDAVGDAGEEDIFSELMSSRSSSGWLAKISDYARDPVDALGQVYTCLKVVHSPASAPFSIATLQLINETMTNLNANLTQVGRQIDQVADRIDKVRSFYELLACPNKIQDGTVPFPENQIDISLGISIEFRNVSFKYSEEGETFALKNVSFKIEQGQLCVVVGENGSGKSTILTLINRIYDVTEGEILINGLNIRTLKLADLRKAIAVLDQSYSIFPLTLAQNIGYGDPKSLDDLDKVQQAAKLGGADEFIDALPFKYKTFVSRPVMDYSNSQPGFGSVFTGKKVDFSKLKLNGEVQNDMSGGQKQRIALSRTFMKSHVSEENSVGMLLFDEPSASLDPKAEQDLFTRLRELRGSKTMVFSSHRFGKLTRHADIILYISKGEVIEKGSHVELMKQDGEYAKFWNLQAQDFL